MQKLNRIERLKQESLPFEFEKRLEGLEWDRLEKEERFYLASFGIYASSLRPDSCMIRLRLDGGELTPHQAKTVAEISRREKARILLTARSQIELHQLHPRRLYPVWRQLHAQGLSSFQTLSDNFRALVTDPLSDCAPDAIINTFPLIKECQERFLNRPEWIGTIPRKFNTAIIGRHIPSFNPWSNDLLFALARKENQWGFNLLGGRFNATAQNADIFCLPNEVPDLFEAVAKCYKEYGLRGSRSKTRLHHLIEVEGMGQIRQWICEEYGAPLSCAGQLLMQSSSQNRDHLYPIKRYGKYGEINAQTLEEVALEAEKKQYILRLTPHQELWSIPSTLPTLLQPLSQHSPRGAVTACAGSRYCALSLWDIKKDLELLSPERIRARGVNLGFSGCLKGCGRHYHNDLGLIGLRTNLYGPTERAARVFLGATQVPDPTPARMLYYSVPLRKLNDLIETIMEDFERSGLEDFETFSRKILAVYPIGFLQVWYLIRQLHTLDPQTINYFLTHEHSALIRTVEEIEPGAFLGDLNESVRDLSHRLWDLHPSSISEN